MLFDNILDEHEQQIAVRLANDFCFVGASVGSDDVDPAQLRRVPLMCLWSVAEQPFTGFENRMVVWEQTVDINSLQHASPP